MECKQGDMIIYGGAVCRIAGTQEKDLGGRTALYYVLEPQNDVKTVIYAPVDSAHTRDKMQPVLTADQARSFIADMPTESDEDWIEDESRRRQRFKDVITRGDRRELAGLIKAVRANKQNATKGRRRYAADERFLKDAERTLYEELGHALGLAPEDVPAYIAAGEEDAATEPAAVEIDGADKG
jgi:CarD family transcriptional regulator